jgi:hypothetical protein
VFPSISLRAIFSILQLTRISAVHTQFLAAHRPLRFFMFRPLLHHIHRQKQKIPVETCGRDVAVSFFCFVFCGFRFQIPVPRPALLTPSVKSLHDDSVGVVTRARAGQLRVQLTTEASTRTPRSFHQRRGGGVLILRLCMIRVRFFYSSVSTSYRKYTL